MLRSNQLMALLSTNQSKPRRYEVLRAENGDSATIYIYDVIDSFFGVAAEKIVKDLKALTTPVIHVRINSPGGDVFDARAIATAISQHPSKIIAHVDGLAASAASYVAIAAAEVEMSPGSFLMIHRAWSMAFGNAEDLRATADVLEKIDGTLIEDYTKHTGQPTETVAAWLNAETWFTAEEAVTNGFADRVSEDPKASNRWDLSVYASTIPEALILETLEEDPSIRIEAEMEVAQADRRRRVDFLSHIA